MRREEVGEGEDSRWTEYLLYSEKRGFRWLVETSEGWDSADLLDEWPQWAGDGEATLPDGSYSKIWDYSARVIYAAGAFNWRVAVGDTVRVSEFRAGNRKLSMEANDEEITWSRGASLTADKVLEWFGKPKPVGAAVKSKVTQSVAASSYMTTAKRLVLFLAMINAIPFIVNADDTFTILLFGVGALLIPAWLMDMIANTPGTGGKK